MTFFIPPVFLFGNNANRFHNNEEEKSEYKTAAETEIKVENWRAKRIAELEEENRKLKEELAHYKNTDAIQNSNRKSVYTSEEQELLDLDYGTGFTAKFVRK